MLTLLLHRSLFHSTVDIGKRVFIANGGVECIGYINEHISIDAATVRSLNRDVIAYRHPANLTPRKVWY